MNKPTFVADTITALLHRQTIATLPEVMAALGTRVRRTAFRKLSELAYRSSYSHRGAFYTLDELIDFDTDGLWTFNGVHFSAAGTLLATAQAFVHDAEDGYRVEELDSLLQVGTRNALHRLVRQARITRETFGGRFLYCAGEPARKAQQLRARRARLAALDPGHPLPETAIMPAELHAAIVLFVSLLDERQRRLFAGLESLKCGWGGDRRVAELLGIDPATVARGRRQLLAREVERDRVRRPGGGRKAVEKKRRRSSPASRR